MRPTQLRTLLLNPNLFKATLFTLFTLRKYVILDPHNVPSASQQGISIVVYVSFSIFHFQFQLISENWLQLCPAPRIFIKFNHFLQFLTINPICKQNINCVNYGPYSKVMDCLIIPRGIVIGLFI